MKKSVFNFQNKDWNKLDPETLKRLRGSQTRTRAFIIGLIIQITMLQKNSSQIHKKRLNDHFD